MRKRLVFMCIIAGFFLNSCAAAGIVVGGLTLGCVGYENSAHVFNPKHDERCPVLDVVDDHVFENLDHLTQK